MMKRKALSHNAEKGQALVEYSMILASVAVVVVVILALLGPALSKTYNHVAANLDSANSPAQPTAAPTAAPTPVPTRTFCADEHQYCPFSGTKQVQYGANGVYTEKTATNGIMCENAVFGDPLYGTFKHCNIR